MNLKKIIILGLIPFFILIILYIYIVTKVDYNDKMPIKKQNLKNNSFNIKNHLTNLSSNNLINTFPYKVFLDSIDINDIEAIKNSILEINIVSKDNMLSQQIISTALTDTFSTYSIDKFNIYHPDNLILQLQWVERFKYYADLDKTNENLYMAVDDFWMSKITNNLIDYSKENYWLKYDYKFKFISSLLETNGYNTSIGFNDLEKVINNVIENKYSYIFERFYTRTTDFQKIIIFSFLILFSIINIYGYYCIFQIHKKNSYVKKN